MLQKDCLSKYIIKKCIYIIHVEMAYYYCSKFDCKYFNMEVWASGRAFRFNLFAEGGKKGFSLQSLTQKPAKFY